MAVFDPFGSDSGTVYVEKSHRPSRLSLVDLSVREITGPYQHHSRLEIALHNTGDRLVVIDGARIEIRRAYAVPLCFTQGTLPLSNTYGLLLPIGASDGRVVTKALHQQIGPDRADRFDILLGAKASTDGELPGDYLFELDVSLENDGPSSPFRLGRVFVTLPEIPRPSEFYWTDTTAEGINKFLHPDYRLIGYLRTRALPCWRRNTAMLARVLARKGIRSPELDEIASQLATPVFSELKTYGSPPVPYSG